MIAKLSNLANQKTDIKEKMRRTVVTQMGVSKPTTITQPPPKLEAPEIPIPMSIRHLVYGKEQNQMYKLMGMTKYQYLKTTERMRYMR